MQIYHRVLWIAVPPRKTAAMARRSFFSSPALYDAVDGDRLGMSRFKGTRGTDGPADAVLHLNRVRIGTTDCSRWCSLLPPLSRSRTSSA